MAALPLGIFESVIFHCVPFPPPFICGCSNPWLVSSSAVTQPASKGLVPGGGVLEPVAIPLISADLATCLTVSFLDLAD